MRGGVGAATTSPILTFSSFRVRPLMGNTCTCIRHVNEVDLSASKVGSRASKAECLATEHEATSSSPPLLTLSESMLETTPGGGVTSIEQQIEQSRRHWSQLAKVDSSAIQDEVADNVEVFSALQQHPTWGTFFRTFDEGAGRSLVRGKYFGGKLVVGEKFAEGGQAELFHAQVKWAHPNGNAWDLKLGTQWVLKVFKKGTLLRHLQSQLPHGFLQFRAEEWENWKSPTPKLIPRYYCHIKCGTLLKDGRFAFLMGREQEDLCSVIDRNMRMRTRKNGGPFPKEDAEKIMYDVAVGMDWLHSRNIVHRDLKASNVLITLHNGKPFQCFVADYECSIGVIGTSFFRAPEILEACKDKSVSTRPELFTKHSDVYSYGMTCYEILTGKLPFDGHSLNDYDMVLRGQCPLVPNFVDIWAHGMLRGCWHPNPTARPSFEDILNLFLVNSAHIRKLKEERRLSLDKVRY